MHRLARLTAVSHVFGRFWTWWSRMEVLLFWERWRDSRIKKHDKLESSFLESGALTGEIIRARYFWAETDASKETGKQELVPINVACLFAYYAGN